jgi:hypothetical protein
MPWTTLASEKSQLGAEHQESSRGPASMSLLVNRASMKGMLVFDYTSHFPEAWRM